MKQKIWLLAIVLLSGVALQSCKKEEGEGGTSTIKGKVIVHNFDPAYSTAEPGEIYPAADEKVYIIYGDESTTYDDDFNTSYDGSYEFKHLQKGTYKLFVYSKDSTGAHSPTGVTPHEKKIVLTTVNISDNGSTVDAPELIILDNKFQ